MWTEDYLRLEFEKGGRARPRVDCWGLYSLILRERAGVDLPEYTDVVDKYAIARTLKREREGSGWAPVETGTEREFDLVLMHGIVGEGRETTHVPMHVGCVIRPALMIDIEEGREVQVRAYRTTKTRAALQSVATRVIGIYRPAVLCAWA